MYNLSATNKVEGGVQMFPCSEGVTSIGGVSSDSFLAGDAGMLTIYIYLQYLCLCMLMLTISFSPGHQYRSLQYLLSLQVGANNISLYAGVPVQRGGDEHRRREQRLVPGGRRGGAPLLPRSPAGPRALLIVPCLCEDRAWSPFPPKRARPGPGPRSFRRVPRGARHAGPGAAFATVPYWDGPTLDPVSTHRDGPTLDPRWEQQGLACSQNYIGSGVPHS